MRARIMNWVLLGLLSAILLTGCSRDRLRSQGGQPSAGDNNPPGATQQTLPTVIQPTTETTVLQPTSVAPQPTPAAAEPTGSQGGASSADVSQAADDLTNLMNGLTKDLDATDTLDDVK